MTALLWLATYLVHSTVLGGAAAVCRRTLRKFVAAETIWRAVVVLPLLSSTIAPLSDLGSWGPAIPGLRFDLNTFGGASAPDWEAITPVLLFLIGIMSTGLVMRDLFALAWFIRRLGPRGAAPSAVFAMIRALSRQGAVRQTVRVTQSASLASPVALGLGEICIPARAAVELAPGQLRILLAHELAHIRRRDSLWFAALAVIESALFFQPLNRIARHELERLAELACDEWAARLVADPEAVAECLVEVLAWSRGRPPAMIPGAVGTSGLTERVMRLVGPRPRSIGPAKRVCLVALSAAAFALPAVPAQMFQSEAYRTGFEAGRREAALRQARGLPPSPRTPTSPADYRRRADLERALQDRRSESPLRRHR